MPRKLKTPTPPPSKEERIKELLDKAADFDAREGMGGYAHGCRMKALGVELGCEAYGWLTNVRHDAATDRYVIAGFYATAAVGKSHTRIEHESAAEVQRLAREWIERETPIAALRDAAHAHAPEVLELLKQFRDFSRRGGSFSYPPGSLQEIHALIDKLEGRS